MLYYIKESYGKLELRSRALEKTRRQLKCPKIHIAISLSRVFVINCIPLFD